MLVIVLVFLVVFTAINYGPQLVAGLAEQRPSAAPPLNRGSAPRMSALAGRGEEELWKNREIRLESQAKWYVLHTYSGYEMMVKDSLEKLIENNNLQR